MPAPRTLTRAIIPGAVAPLRPLSRPLFPNQRYLHTRNDPNPPALWDFPHICMLDLALCHRCASYMRADDSTYYGKLTL